MHQSHTQLFHATDCLDPKDIRAFLQGQPSRTGNQPVQDIAVHAITCQRDGLVSGSTWLTLKEGTNIFRVEAVRGVKKLRVTLMHRNSYLGV